MNPEKLVATTTPGRESMRPARKRPEDNDSFRNSSMEAVAYALARIHDPAVSLFGRIVVAGDPADSGPIERDVLQKVLRDYPGWVPKWKAGQPKPRKGDLVRILVRMALIEEIYPNICPRCYGKRWIRVVRLADSDVVPCARCKGRGIHRWTDTDRAEMIDMNYKTYYSTWAKRMSQIKSYFGQYELDIWKVRL